MVCAVASKVLDIFKEDDITGNVKAVGDYLKEKLEAMAKEYPFIKEVRGKDCFWVWILTDLWPIL